MAVLYETLDGHPPEEAGIVDEGLEAYNQESAPLDAVEHLTCLARDGGGRRRSRTQCERILQHRSGVVAGRFARVISRRLLSLG